MALVGLKRASELTGKNQSTMHRAMKSGRISYSTNDSGERLVDTAELNRVFPIQHADNIEMRKDAAELQSHDAQLLELRAQLEVERVKVGMLWRAQAEQANLLLTDRIFITPYNSTPGEGTSVCKAVVFGTLIYK